MSLQLCQECYQRARQRQMAPSFNLIADLLRPELAVARCSVCEGVGYVEECQGCGCRTVAGARVVFSTADDGSGVSTAMVAGPVCRTCAPLIATPELIRDLSDAAGIPLVRWDLKGLNNVSLIGGELGAPEEDRPTDPMSEVPS